MVLSKASHRTSVNNLQKFKVGNFTKWHLDRWLGTHKYQRLNVYMKTYMS